jgi:poly(3-hydroxybutyrate) depolymerase
MLLPRSCALGSFFTFAFGLAASACSVTGAEDTLPGPTAGAAPSGSGGGSAGTTAMAGGGTTNLPAMGGAGTGGQVEIGGTAGTFAGGGVANAGAAGASGAAGSGGGGRPSGPSPGCMNGKGLQDEPQKAIQHDLMVTTVAEKYKPTYVPRKYYTSLPQNFDATKPYPVVFYGQGCGQTGPESGPFSNGDFASQILYVQLIPASVTAETVVPEGGAPGCFQAGRRGLADSPDGPYFDMALAEIAQNYCIDMGQLYAAGWSSGAWLSNYLACARGNVLRGTAAGSGGLHHDHGKCTGGARVMLLPGDAANTDELGFNIGAEPARDLFIMVNGCSTTPTDVQLGNQTCQVYGGCDNPVAWCPAGGGHGGPLQFIAPSAWAFWNSP